MTSASETGRAAELIRALKMEPLEGESGYFAVIGRSNLRVSSAGQTLAAQSSIYYLLTQEKPLNYLHWLVSDDTHVLIEGGPVDYFLFHADGHAEKVTLGRDFAAGERLVINVPGDCWKSVRLVKGATHALMANVLSPEWAPDRVKIGAGQAFIQQYQSTAPWATAAFLRELIGPNFKDAAIRKE